MAQIVIQINGREVTAATVMNPLHGLIIKQMEEQMRQKLGGIICPEHLAAPSVTIDIAGARQHVAVAGCCQHLIDMTTHALTALP